MSEPDPRVDPGNPAAPKLEPEDLKALADRVIAESSIPKKVPAVDDIDGQVKALGGALADALLTATDVPLTALGPFVGDLASQLVAYGIRQTEHVDPDAMHAPAWITDGVKQQSIKLPAQARHTEAAPVVERTAEGPKTCPKRLAKSARAVRR
ncbi:hypothetical protein [Mycolicibacterium sp. F2034L]|uniref:hypothetical protein n=1 Tax=Mycolicibacterium sp. F2034L TaxID=2926422 RepID=UPI001FF66E8C|nr:hypothetical protein [Mycolicibacterium sp. F2034L]MCK0174810.1 hypothetical protein [Mycolicibacterium sp. F2034L]